MNARAGSRRKSFASISRHRRTGPPFNTGSSTVTVSSRQIFSTDGGFTNTQLGLIGDGCKNPLGADKGCQFSASTGQFAYAYTCRAVTSGIEENLSGTMQVMNSTGQILLTIPMKK